MPTPQAQTATRPGQIVSVDQLESTTAGFIAQLKGKLTTTRYKFATVYIEQLSRFTYVHLQRTLTLDKTVKRKKCFKWMTEAHGMIVKHYHSDNGRFTNNGFVNHCQNKQKNISCCGMNTYSHNGIAEKKIWGLQEQTHMMMLYAINKWQDMVTIHLWPYGL